MSDALLTKKAIAEGLKELTKTKPFDKISISDITGSCGLNRQTFYYHFQDKYELLNWIYYHEGFLPVIDNITLSNWDERICWLLNNIRKEKHFYMNTIKSAEDNFREYLYRITETLFEEAIEALDIEKVLTKEDISFFAQFYSLGVSGMIVKWVYNGMKEDPAYVAGKLKYLALSSEKAAYQRYLIEHPDMKN